MSIISHIISEERKHFEEHQKWWALIIRALTFGGPRLEMRWRPLIGHIDRYARVKREESRPVISNLINNSATAVLPVGPSGPFKPFRPSIQIPSTADVAKRQQPTRSQPQWMDDWTAPNQKPFIQSLPNVLALPHPLFTRPLVRSCAAGVQACVSKDRSCSGVCSLCVLCS